MRKRLVVLAALAMLTAPLAAAELEPRTVAAFDRYIRLTDVRMDEEARTGRGFLRIDSLPDDTRRVRLEQLTRGQVVIDKLQTRENGASIDVPSGIIHHWVGVVFVPGARVGDAVTLMQDYDRHAVIFRPAVQASRLRSRDGDTFRLHLRFFMKKIVAVTLNTEHEARFFRPAPDRAYSRIVSTRIAEVDHAGTPREAEKPVGQGNGFMWRLNTYWRFLERDGGTYVQCESITLSRDIPFAFRWIVGPFVTSIPRESLNDTLARLRSHLSDSLFAVRGSLLGSVFLLPPFWQR